jgi:hypothetical protein
MGDRAECLADELKRDTLTGPARVLADQAVIITERLEELDRVLRGTADCWLGVVERLGGEVAEVTISQPLAEERQQAMALKGVLAELAKHLDLAPAAPVASVTDQLKAKREARRSGAM